jgi:hypothetical protein
MIKKQEGLFESRVLQWLMLSPPVRHSEPAAPLGCPPRRGRWGRDILIVLWPRMATRSFLP